MMAIDPTTKELLYYEDKVDSADGMVTLDKGFLLDNPAIQVHNDKEDCYVDICAPEVLSLFTYNFDYQHLWRHFVKGLLVDDIMGYKIFIKSKPSSLTHQTRLGNDELVMAIDPSTKELWYYEDKVDSADGMVILDKGFLLDNPAVQVHNDKEIMGYKIYTQEILKLCC